MKQYYRIINVLKSSDGPCELSGGDNKYSETRFHPSFVSFYLAHHETDHAPNVAYVIQNKITVCVQKAGCNGGTERNSVSPFIPDRSSCSPRNRTYIKLSECSYVRRYYLNLEFSMLWATPNQNRFSLHSWPVWRLGNNALLTNTKRHSPRTHLRTYSYINTKKRLLHDKGATRTRIDHTMCSGSHVMGKYQYSRHPMRCPRRTDSYQTFQMLNNT